MMFFFFKQKTAYEMRISDWSSDVCSSDLAEVLAVQQQHRAPVGLGGGGDVHVRHRQLLLLRIEFEALDRVRVGEAFELRAVERRFFGDGGGGGKREGEGEGQRGGKLAAHGVFRGQAGRRIGAAAQRSEENTSELQSLMRISYAVFCLKKNNK